MSEKNVKKVQPKRSFLEPLRAEEPHRSSKHKVKPLPTEPTSKAPTTTLEWLHFASRLLISTSWNVEAGERVLMVCEEVASMLLEQDAQVRTSTGSTASTGAEALSTEFSPMEGGGGGAASETESGDYAASVLVGDGVATLTQECNTSAQRLQAAYLLTAAAVAALDVHQISGTETAIRLSRTAVEAYHCPMTACTLAMSCVRLGVTSRDIDRRSAAFRTAFSVITTAGEFFIEGEVPSKEDAGYLLRMAWMLASIGARDESRKYLALVLQHHPKSYLGLLLMTLQHTAEGNLDDANKAVMHLLSAYPDDVVAVIVRVSINQRYGLHEAPDDRGKDSGTEELVVAMARISKMSDAASAEGSRLRKRSLKALCRHCAPDEDVEGGPKHTTAELKRRVVGHWALLSHVATRLGCATVADVATEAGTDAIAQSKLLYGHSLADLHCSMARRSLIRLRDRIVGQHTRNTNDPLGSQVRDLNLLGTLDFNVSVSGGSGNMFLGSPLTTGVANCFSSPSPALSDSHSYRVLPSRLFDAVASTLLAAVEAWPSHGEGHMLLGVTRLLEASQRDVPSDIRHNRLQEAGRHFLNSMQADAAIPEAYLGAGVVAEAQGTLNESFDFYASAAEVSVHAPLIPWRYFDYLYQ